MSVAPGRRGLHGPPDAFPAGGRGGGHDARPGYHREGRDVRHGGRRRLLGAGRDRPATAGVPQPVTLPAAGPRTTTRRPSARRTRFRRSPPRTPRSPSPTCCPEFITEEYPPCCPQHRHAGPGRPAPEPALDGGSVPLPRRPRLFEGRRAMLIDGVIVEEGADEPAARDRRTKPRTRSAKPSAAVGTSASPSRSSSARRPIPNRTWRSSPEGQVIIPLTQDGRPHRRGVGHVPAVRHDREDQPVRGRGDRDYWVLDVNARQLLVYRDPKPDAAQHHGHGYATVITLGPADTVSPLAGRTPRSPSPTCCREPRLPARRTRRYADLVRPRRHPHLLSTRRATGTQRGAAVAAVVGV